MTNQPKPSPLATSPYCLDSEFIPHDLFAQWEGTITPALQKARGKAVYREFIRSLLFSPQVVIGRQCLAENPILVRAVTDAKQRAAIERLIDADHFYIQLGSFPDESGIPYTEKSLADVFATKGFRGDPEAMAAWLSIEGHSARQMRFMLIDPHESGVVARRFERFFETKADSPALVGMLNQTLERSASDTELEAFRRFWKEDVLKFMGFLQTLRKRPPFTRSMIYDQYVWGRDSSGFTSHEPPANDWYSWGDDTQMYLEYARRVDRELRAKHRVVMKTITDLAYLANTPASLDIKSFVPPHFPDPSSLPPELYRKGRVYNQTLETQRNAVAAASREIIEARLDLADRTYYRVQRFQKLPDFDSFKLSDAIDIMYGQGGADRGWPEWRRMMDAQVAIGRFQSVEEYRRLRKEYEDATFAFYARLEREFQNRPWWTSVATGSVHLTIAVSAHIMGHAIAPGAMEALPETLKIAAYAAMGHPIERGIDILVFGRSDLGRLISTVGMKYASTEEFTSTEDEVNADLERFKAVSEKLDEQTVNADRAITDASDTIASEG